MHKISIITVSYNSDLTILDTIKSVNTQTYANVEHIFVDGGSTDNTCEIIRQKAKYGHILTSEADNGIYNAMNKGFRLATGDFIAFLNSDDIYCDPGVLREVMQKFDNGADIVYGDLYFTNFKNEIKRVWITGPVPRRWRSGFQIPHPALFIRKNILTDKSQMFDEKFRLAADLKLQLQLSQDTSLKYEYLQRNIVNMKLGGESTKSMRAVFDGFKETVQAYNDIFNSGGYLYAVKKLLFKITQKLKYNMYRTHKENV